MLPKAVAVKRLSLLLLLLPEKSCSSNEVTRLTTSTPFRGLDGYTCRTLQVASCDPQHRCDESLTDSCEANRNPGHWTGTRHQPSAVEASVCDTASSDQFGPQRRSLLRAGLQRHLPIVADDPSAFSRMRRDPAPWVQRQGLAPLDALVADSRLERAPLVILRLSAMLASS